MNIAIRHSTRRLFLAGAGAAVIATSVPARAAEASVKQFGAHGDGRQDDTAAIQQALESGMPIFIPAGTYLISRTLWLGDGTRIRGSGPQSVLKKTSEQVDRVLQNANHAQEIYLADFTIDGSRQSKEYVALKDAIMISKCRECIIERLSVKNCLNNGIIIDGGSDNKVRNCYSAGNAKDGIYISGSEECEVNENYCENNDVTGIGVAASFRIAVYDNISINNGSADFMLARDALSVEIFHNKFGPGSDYSIFVSAEPLPIPVRLHGIDYPGGDVLYGARECVIRSNTLHGKVSLILFDDGIVEGNTISGSVAQGLLLHGSSRNRVLNNQISGWNSAFPGLQLAALDLEPKFMASDRLGSGPKPQVLSEDNVLDGNVLLGGLPSSVHITGRNQLNGKMTGS